MVKDPVCGMEVNPDKANYVRDYKGKTYYFCSQSCMNEFNGSPEKFIGEEDHGHGAHGGHSMHGGCCGMMMGGSGWQSYILLGLIITLIILRFILQ